MEKKYIGIDCGLNGGIAFLEDGKLCTMPMPKYKAGKGEKINIVELSRILNRSTMLSYRHIVEDPGGHAPSASGLRSMTYSFAVIETLLVSNAATYETVISRRWQAEFWSRPKMPTGVKFNTKAAALEAVRKIFPSHDFTPTERATKPHDGEIDAALLADWGRRKNL